ncbi:hypothetical protein DPMN_065827 [Dreissena polymorpha]|uniref:Uncharacterized protein n=1 Tax=Dreissena polymorpha TaxID=45954 RepID=A0A9D4BJY7_DREPO|nr:hypothetical protein DPMN_065827 [Dreissena polymorpha]
MYEFEKSDGETYAAKNILPEKIVDEKLNQLDQQLAEILKHDANERSLVVESVVRVTDYLQNFQAMLESVVNFLKTEVISQSEMQNCVLLQNFDTRQTSITYLRDQISTDRDSIDAIKQHGNDRHVFLLRRKITKEIRDIESRTQQLNQSKVASNIEVVEPTPVDNIARTIKGALRVQTNVRGAEDYG